MKIKKLAFLIFTAIVLAGCRSDWVMVDDFELKSPEGATFYVEITSKDKDLGMSFNITSEACFDRGESKNTFIMLPWKKRFSLDHEDKLCLFISRISGNKTINIKIFDNNKVFKEYTMSEGSRDISISYQPGQNALMF